MTDPSRAAYESALHKLNELSERLAIGRENDDYLHRLANAAQNVAIAAREVYAEGRVAEMKTAARSFMRRSKEHVADRLRENKSVGKEKGMAKQTLG